MRIGLINIEPKIFNTAYMQISQYHKLRGDVIEWWTPLTDRRYGHVYCSSIFSFTDKSDVPEKEGRIHAVVPANINPRGSYITVCDNSFFANPLWEKAVDFLVGKGQPVDMQGIDVRDITGSQAAALTRLQLYKRVKIAWDNPKDDRAVLDGIKCLTRFIKPYKIMCYVLIGFNTVETEDLGRIRMLRELGIDPFVMPFDKFDRYQRALAGWVNHKAIFKKVPWEEYKGRVDKQEFAGHGWRNNH